MLLPSTIEQRRGRENTERTNLNECVIHAFLQLPVALLNVGY